MEPLNLSTDIQKYLGAGPLTQPIAQDARLKTKLDELKSDKEKVYALLSYLLKHVSISFDNNFNAEHKFNRTAEEIWESHKATGCTDWALLFATFARQNGIPTTFFTTAEESWVTELLNGTPSRRVRGHSFCECFIDGKWQLVDPTMSKIQANYNPNYIHLSGLTHYVGGKKNFIPYLRDIDLGQRQNMQIFVNNMVTNIEGSYTQNDLGLTKHK